MTDRSLAWTVYSLSGIPWRDWDAHFRCDQERPISTRPSDKLSDDARATYRVILASYKHEHH